MREKTKAESQKTFPNEYWRLLHSWATKAIEESHYRPTRLAEIRGALLNATEGLGKAGYSNLAEEIKQQIGSFNQSAPSRAGRESGKTIQRVGTAFVARPDSFLLAAFHVVKDAKEIEVSCPELGKANAWVGAVLRSKRSRGAPSVSMRETVTPWEFSVEGESGSEADEHGGDGPQWGSDRSDGEGDAAAVYPQLQAEDRPGD